MRARGAAMTEEEFARARAEYDALPGTPPDRRSFRSNAEIGDRDIYDVIPEMIVALGGKFQRLTKSNDGIWLEVWDERPFKQAPPPV